ncbi:hypothetical protein CPB86DRAFT_820318 [Serendipita vermifera]|nr:hypothetical protein CPB86DRAFT_820318 [Serendipita vermifera]
MDPKNLGRLRPSARNKLLGQECHKSPDAARKVAARLNAQDVGVVLVHSLSFEDIIPALHHEYPITRNLAAKAFQKAWLTQPASQVAQAVGGAEGLADILNTVPFQDAKNLATKLGHHYRGADDPRTQILDSLVYLLNPSLNQESGQKTHPISRLGSTLTFPLLPALSPNTVWQLIPSVRPADKHRLRVLLQNQPTIIAELLSIEREKYNNTNLRLSPRELNMLFTMPSVRGVEQKPESHWGLELFLELLEKTNHTSKLIFQPSLAELVNYTTLLLRHAPNEKQWLNLLDQLLSRAEANKQSQRLSLLVFIPIIRAVSRKLAKCEEGNARLDATALEGVIKRIGSVALGVNTATSAPMLPTIAPSTRAKVMRLLNNMTQQDDWKFPEDLPQLTLSTVATLGPSHGEPLLRKLTSYFYNTSFQGNGLSFTEHLGTLKRLVNLAPADTQDMITAAVRGRWAFFGKDKEGQQETRNAIERWKKLIHKQRKPEGRVDYTNALILVTVIIEDVQLMEEATIWSLERFLKDQDVRPALINQIKGSCTPVIAGLLQDFEENAKHGDIILSAFIDTIDKARKEPGFNSGDSDTCYMFIYDVLKSRMHLAQNHRLPVEIIERAISPLAELFLRVEKMCLNDPGTFNLFPNYPTTYGWYQIGRSVSSGRSGSLSKAVRLSTPYRRVVTRFMDKLAAQREAIHKERRESLEILGRDLNDWDQRYPWPYHVDADFLKDFPWEEDAPVLLEYLNKVIYTNLTKDQVDEKDITSGSWYSALTLLADSLKKDPERTTKFLLPIIDHHRTKAVSESGDVTDISAHLMYSDSFMRAVWKNEALLEAFYAPYLSRKEEDNHLELFFGAPEPTDESYQEDSRFKLLTQRQGGPYSLDNMSNGILPKFKVKGSHHLRRHLVIVAVVLWFHAAKAKPPEQYEFMAVDNAPLDFSVIYSSTKIPISNRRKSGRREISFVARSIFLLSEPEIKNIISSLKQLLPREDDQPHLDRALQRLVSKALPRSHVPRALEEDMFTILSNPEKSSIHRHFLPYSKRETYI